jgi:hypothetical protein
VDLILLNEGGSSVQSKVDAKKQTAKIQNKLKSEKTLINDKSGK